jgi:hypothetical protein
MSDEFSRKDEELNSKYNSMKPEQMGRPIMGVLARLGNSARILEPRGSI